MKILYIILLSILLLSACSRIGLLHQPPRVTSAESAVDVSIHNLIPDSRVTFSINDVRIYGFHGPGQFDFVLDAGSYLFAYKNGSQKCDAEVELNTGHSYVFDLKPDCNIEMQ